jgi:hypothetical protein
MKLIKTISFGSTLAIIVVLIIVFNHYKSINSKQMTAVEKPTQSLETMKLMKPIKSKTESQSELVKSNATSSKISLIQELKGIRRCPPINLSSNFISGDEQLLLDEYVKTERLTDRIGLIWVLAHIGGEQTSTKFIHTLTDEFNGRVLKGDEVHHTENEVGVMETITFCMGFLAQRDDKAWNFLQKAIDPSYWKNSITWRSSMDLEIHGMLTESSIDALGISSRPEVPQLLQSLRQSPPKEVDIPDHLKRGFEGAIMQAAYYYDLLKEKGGVEFNNRFSRVTDVFDADGSWGRWITTPNGAEWQKWFDQRKGLKN